MPDTCVLRVLLWPGRVLAAFLVASAVHIVIFLQGLLGAVVMIAMLGGLAA